jgi:hypothetical protein
VPPVRALVVAAALAGCSSSPPASTDDASSSTSGTDTGSSTTDVGTPTSSSTGESSSEGADSTDESSESGPAPDPVVITLIDDAIYYDGYAPLVDEPVPEGLVRLANSLYATRFTDEHRAQLQSTLMLGVIVGARCDNYDRIGSIHLALVPKGADTYVPAEVDRIELGRFITPFMDMNDSPMTVPYEFVADDVLPILTDDALAADYDLWFELDIFGVPYAANTEIDGCADRIDTQSGTLLLYTDSARPARELDVLQPLAIKVPFNNYTEGASDELGTTRKTLTLELATDAEEAQLVLITSNHGANAGGEEYIRRDHFVYVDDELVLEYMPGRTSCEPFRVYNTQANGIYGPSAMTDEEWQSFSNWCPGDVIDTRIIPLGAVSAGEHEFVIDVPDAEFADMQGDFPFSLYLQAR